MSDDSTAREHEELLRELQELGISAPPTDDLGIAMPSADEFVAQMKRKDNARANRRRLMTLGGLAAAAALVVTTVVVEPWRTDPASAATPPILDFEYANARDIGYAPGIDATEVLREAAASALALPGVRGNPATQSQTVTRDTWYAEIDDTSAVVIPRLIRASLNPDGSIRSVETRGEPLSADGRGVPVAEGHDRPGTKDETTEPGTLDPNLLARVRDDPQAAREALLDRAECVSRERDTTATSCLYQQAIDIWTFYDVDATAASNLWTVLAEEEGLSNLGTVTDRAGRPGVGIAFTTPTSPEFRNILIISPTTGRLLGEEQILVKTLPDVDLKTPAIYSFTAILDSEWTDAPD